MSFNLQELYKDDYALSQAEMDILRQQAIVDEEKRSFVESNLTRLHSAIDAANGRGEPVLPHLVVDMIIRRMYKDNKPSTSTIDGQQPIPNQPIAEVKIQRVLRNEDSIILSYEDTSKRRARYEEIDAKRFDYKTSIFNHVMNIKFEEFTKQVEDEVNNYKQLLTSLMDEVLLLKASLDGANASIDLSEQEKARMNAALSAANNQLSSLSNQMSKQQEDAQQRLSDAEKQSAKAIQDMTDKLVNEINKNESDLKSLRSNVDKLQDKISDANKKAEEAKKAADDAAKEAADNKKKADQKKADDKKFGPIDKPDEVKKGLDNLTDLLDAADVKQLEKNGEVEGNIEVKKIEDKFKITDTPTTVTDNKLSLNTLVSDNIFGLPSSGVGKILDKIEDTKPDPKYIKRTKLEADIKVYETYIINYKTEYNEYQAKIAKLDKDVEAIEDKLDEVFGPTDSYGEAAKKLLSQPYRKPSSLTVKAAIQERSKYKTIMAHLLNKIGWAESVIKTLKDELSKL